jgi:cytochrome c oxidase assembly protein subunit 15
MDAAAQPLYDLSPLFWLLLVGVLTALGPLAWVWWRNRGASSGRRLQALTVLTLFLTFDLVLFGAFTRLTDSGLGCPDWPGCYGNASPIGAHADIAAAQAVMPTGPVTHGKAWVEMVHRYLASGVGFLLIVLTVASWVGYRRARAARAAHGHGLDDGLTAVSPWWPTVTLVWVCIQGAFGALTVTMKLFPAIVTLHLLGGLALLFLLCAQAVLRTHAVQQRRPVPVSSGLRVLLWGVFALLTVQVALGGWVSTNYAVLVCTEFPSCQGSYWPPMDFQQGFQLWRPLGLLQDGSHISFAGLTAIHYAHRLFAYLVLLGMAVLAWRLVHTPGLRAQGRWLGWLALLQLATGLSNVVLGWPLVAAVLHTGGAAALTVVLTWAIYDSQADVLPSRVSV